MHRRILIQVTAPAVVVGLLLCVTCLISAWYIQRLQANTATILSENVASLKAAQELEIRVRQLRFHVFVYLIDPKPERLAPIELDHARFEEALRDAERSAGTPAKRDCVQAIREGYRQYRDELTQLRQDATRGMPPADFGKLADSHPVRHVVEPCQQLLTLNQAAMQETSRESDRVSQEARWIMLFVGLVGPFGGLFSGLGMARGLSRSICQLSVRVQDMAQRLDQDVASVSLVADGNIESLDKQLEHVLHRVEEVTDGLHRQHRDMLRAEQLAAVGQLAASVAHEVRNPLTSVKMLVELALRPRSPKPLTSDDLHVIHREIARLEQTVQSFLDFARLPTPRRTKVDLREVVARAVELVQARCRQQKVEMDVRCSEQPLWQAVDGDQLRTVLVNLSLNALDAMPHGGRLAVELEASGDGALFLRVKDTGSGIAPEIAERLFTPFTSTKPTGTGLGLSISRRIIEEHGGRLTAENRPEGGACFTIWLPYKME